MLATDSAQVTAAVLAEMGGLATCSVDVHSSELEPPAAELISLILQLVSAGMVKSTASATVKFDHCHSDTRRSCEAGRQAHLDICTQTFQEHHGDDV